jgi:transcriptional regulatory protein RtcR
MTKKKVVFGFLGTKLDGSGSSEQRWNRWRPTVSLFAHENFQVDALELLLTNKDHLDLAQRVSTDIGTLNPSVEVTAHVLEVADPWDFSSMYAALHEFAKTYAFEDNCDYYVHLTTGTHVAQICLFLLLEARYFPAKILESFSHGAQPGEEWKGRLEVIDLNVAAYDQLAQRFKQERWDSQDILKGGIATKNAAFNTLIGRIERVALASSAPILLCGPTGAGKSQLAKRIYELRNRRHLVTGPLVEVNCATLRGDNAMSALFGHKKGAFTGAAADRTGMLKAADKGLLFLDEIGELGLDEQAILLRALEEKRFRPLGSDKEIESDFQLLAGTNRDLSAMSSKGLFREDLLARINLWEFTLPGLKDRREDIAPNVDFETARVSNLLGKHVTWSTPAKDLFLEFSADYSWPGNFRDLSGCITRLATLAEGARITEDDVKEEVEQIVKAHKKTRSPNAAEKFELSTLVLGEERTSSTDIFEVVQIEAVLSALKSTSSMAQAGRLLFAASRERKASSNDSDRIRKFLGALNLDYATVKQILSK